MNTRAHKIALCACAVIVIAAAGVLFAVIRNGARETQSFRASAQSPVEAVVKAPEKIPEPVPPSPADALPDPVPPKQASATAEFASASAKAPAAVEEIDDLYEETAYYAALVFKDEALATFPVHTVDIHTPESMLPKRTDSAGRPIPWPNPGKSEIWIRVKPGNAREMREIMAQTADLYRLYAHEHNENIRAVNWVGGQPWAAATFGPDGKEIKVQ